MYHLYITNSGGTRLSDLVKHLVPLDGSKVLEYDDYLSSFGTARFRLQTKDPIAATGIFVPYKNHVKIYRDNVCVWAGIIIDLPHQNHKFIEVRARTYAWLLTKVIAEHTSGTPNYREFSSGTMTTAVTTLFNEGKNRSNSPISTFTLGEIENPNYPWDGNPWNFSATYSLKFEYCSLFQVINSFADITNADFTVTKDKVFTFKKRIGADRKDIALKFGKGGNITDYDAPYDGSNFSNDFICASLNKDGTSVIRSEKQDTSTFTTYGRVWNSVLIADQIEQNILNEKANGIYKLNNRLDAEVHLELSEKAMPIGTYNLGDTIHISIKDGPININKDVRVVGWKVTVDSLMNEKPIIITNNL